MSNPMEWTTTTDCAMWKERASNKVEVRKDPFLEKTTRKKRAQNPLEMLQRCCSLITQPQEFSAMSVLVGVSVTFFGLGLRLPHSEVKFAVVIGGSRDPSCVIPELCNY